MNTPTEFCEAIRNVNLICKSPYQCGIPFKNTAVNQVFGFDVIDEDCTAKLSRVVAEDSVVYFHAVRSENRTDNAL